MGARAANGGDKVLWECIGPYEGNVSNRTIASPGRRLDLRPGKEEQARCGASYAPKAFPLRGRWHGVAVTDEVTRDAQRRKEETVTLPSGGFCFAACV